MGLTVNENFQYEVSKRSMLIAHLKQLQRETNNALKAVDGNFVEKPKALTPAEILAELEQKATSKKQSENYEHRKKGMVIRRRKVFVYSQADQFLASKEGQYWQREKRSLTKFNSNSKMYEYTVVRDR